MKKILPLVFLLIGMGAGVGAGVYLRPDPADSPEKTETDIATEEDGAGKVKADDPQKEASVEEEEPNSETEFLQMSNQFVVPIVTHQKVAALVVLALSIEIPQGNMETVFEREPKLRDSFLRVLFDHANMGGFDGNFTDAHVLGQLRTALREVAQKDLGKKLVKDVLIIEIARQDY